MSKVKRLCWIIPLILFVGVLSFDLISIQKDRLWMRSHLLVAPTTKAKEEELSCLLNQPFSFIDQGSTSIVYLSQDGTVVLKLFLDKCYASKGGWRKIVPFMGRLSERRKELKMKRKRFIGCINAYSLVAEATGMLYYHFSPTTFFSSKLRLLERDGEVREIDLNEVEFILQKKAVVSFDYFDQCALRGEMEKAKKGISDLLDFTLHLYDQGIVMIDLQLMSNFGFIEDRPVRIDLEHLEYDRKWKKRYRGHLEEQLNSFRHYLDKWHPELISHFEEERVRIGS